MKIVAMAAAALALVAVQEKAKPRDNKDRVEIAGKIVCIGCTLESRDGANAQCTLHAKHAQGLLAEDGTLWTFVANGKGHLVITNDKLRGKEVKVLGWKFAKSQYVEISKYQVKDGAKWTPFDYCKICGWEADHDNKDTDLCEGCQEK